jgi:hypothetical protein
MAPCARHVGTKNVVGTAASHRIACTGQRQFLPGSALSSDSWMPCHRVVRQYTTTLLALALPLENSRSIRPLLAASQSPPPMTEPEYAARAAQATSTRNHNRPARHQATHSQRARLRTYREGPDKRDAMFRDGRDGRPPETKPVDD